MKDFRSLEVWKKSHELGLAVEEMREEIDAYVAALMNIEVDTTAKLTVGSQLGGIQDFRHFSFSSAWDTQ